MIPNGAVVAMHYARMLREQDEREERKKQEQLTQGKTEETYNLLLLRGDDNYMEIGATETVVTNFIRHTHSYNGRECNNEMKYVSVIDGVEIIKDTFDELLQFMLNRYQAKGIQIIPHSVVGGKVYSHLLMFKVSDNSKMERKKSLLELADKMTEDIRAAW